MAGGQSKFVTERPTRGSGISAKRKDSRQVQLSFLHLLKILVALHLFSEREKDKLAQLVDTMFFYCITYTISKIEPPERMQGYGASPDAPPLSLDPQSTTLLTLRSRSRELSEIRIHARRTITDKLQMQYQKINSQIFEAKLT
ncbi:uncharacterized protein [Typha angustifolia]|uniref:uncharacterized protein isoform X1 n=1 Tax=Typha angustifolia TaxID=59011 RepID=UPI003C3092FF